ncbi:MAG: hypothetical protein BWY27_00115 [Bacteroidetes bacterium ADurb.Bin234]|nr:MAG: hypothetical protein BWY27_00115 [Bacteroidetes bacterium ADurb.Bin234]
MKSNTILLFFFIGFSFLLNSCDIPGLSNPTDSAQIFKCKIGAAQFDATFITTEGNYSYENGKSIPYGKGLIATNGSSATTGDIQITLSFGCNDSSKLAEGNHTYIQELPKKTDNRGKATLKVKINGNNYTPVVGSGTINVEKFYYSKENYMGAKGTFSNIRVQGYNGTAQETLTLINGEFDYYFMLINK